MRHDSRQPDQLRPLEIIRGFTRPSPGSVLFKAGRTTVLCTASVEESVPPWMKGQGRGWVTAEYNMLPSSTSPAQATRTGESRWPHDRDPTAHWSQPAGDRQSRCLGRTFDRDRL